MIVERGDPDFGDGWDPPDNARRKRYIATFNRGMAVVLGGETVWVWDTLHHLKHNGIGVFAWAIPLMLGFAALVVGLMGGTPLLDDGINNSKSGTEENSNAVGSRRRKEQNQKG